MSKRHDLAGLIDDLRAGDASRLPELAQALHAHSPEDIVSALEAHGLEITGDGNIIGSGNVAIVVKGEFPALAARLADLAEQTRLAERGERAANLFGQSAVLLERGQAHEALNVLAELRTLDAHYPGATELRQRANRLQLRRRLRDGALVAAGLLAVIWVTWSIWQKNQPRRCSGEIHVSEEGVIASAAQSDAGGTRWWIGMSKGGLETFTGNVSGISYDSQDLVADTVSALAIDERAGRIWVGTSGGGLTVLSQSDHQADWRPYTPAASYTEAGEDGLPGCRIRSIYLDDEHVYVGALDGRGLGVLEDGGKWRIIEPPGGWKAGVYFIAYSMAKGDDGALWVGTNYGLYRLSGEDWSRPYQPPWDEGSCESVRAVAVDSGGILWMGTGRQGLVLCDVYSTDDPWIGPFTKDDGLASNEIETIALLPAGDGVLIGTGAGLSICRWEGGKRKLLECEVIRRENLAGVPIHSLTVSPDGEEVLIGTNDQPLVLSLSDLW